jgi:hypothetical protein
MSSSMLLPTGPGHAPIPKHSSATPAVILSDQYLIEALRTIYIARLSDYCVSHKAKACRLDESEHDAPFRQWH